MLTRRGTEPDSSNRSVMWNAAVDPDSLPIHHYHDHALRLVLLDLLHHRRRRLRLIAEHDSRTVAKYVEGRDGGERESDRFPPHLLVEPARTPLDPSEAAGANLVKIERAAAASCGSPTRRPTPATASWISHPG